MLRDAYEELLAARAKHKQRGGGAGGSAALTAGAETPPAPRAVDREGALQVLYAKLRCVLC